MRYVLSLLMLVTFIGCERPQSVHFRGLSQNMPYHIEVRQPLTRHDRIIIKRIIETTFAQVDQISNHWNALSELSLINMIHSTDPIRLSPYLQHFLSLANQIVELSEGRYDPSLTPVISLWKSALNQQKIPSAREVLSASQNTGWDNFTIEGSYIKKAFPRLKLDLDGISKGMAVDILTCQLVESGYENVFADRLATAAMLIEDPEELSQWIRKIKKTNPAISFDNKERQYRLRC